MIKDEYGLSIWVRIPTLVSELCQHLADKWSASQTAEALSRTAGQHISRNAVIGKARRDGIAFESGMDGKYKRGPKKVRQVPYNITRQKSPFIDLPDELPLPADFLGLTLMELPNNGCRYPSGDGPFFFCGQPQWSDSSYCGHHHQICNTGIPQFRKSGESNVSYGTPGGRLSHSP
jgi:hypothetical protein